MLFESGIYTMIMLIALLGVTVFSGSTDGTYEKNCTKIFKTQNEAEYYKYRTCSGFWFWKSCKYVQRTKTVRRPAYMYLPVCCPYFIEVNNTCIKGCEPGKYGENCTYNCTCPTNSIESCEKDTGNCTCVPGKHGDDCNKDCDVGHYGHDCLLTCSCMNNSTCDHVDGFCTCTAGYIGQNCEKSCNEGWYGLNCSFPCNCTSSQTCNPVSGDCTCKPGIKGQDCKQNCICRQPGTSNCDSQRQTCFCSDELKDGACSSANLTTVEQIRSLMTTICNCRIDDAFCVQTNESCYCKNGWTGDQCEIALPKKTFSFGYIIGGVAGILVLIVLVVVVIAVFFCKRRQSTNDAYTVMVYETPDASRNVYYSSLSSNLHKNENVGGNETNTEHHVAIKRSASVNDASGSQ